MTTVVIQRLISAIINIHVVVGQYLVRTLSIIEKANGAVTVFVSFRFIFGRGVGDKMYFYYLCVRSGDVFHYDDEFNVSWLPTLRAMRSPKGQQVMIPTLGQPKLHYGLGAVNYHSGETVVIIRRRKRRLEVAELLQTPVDKQPS